MQLSFFRLKIGMDSQSDSVSAAPLWLGQACSARRRSRRQAAIAAWPPGYGLASVAGAPAVNQTAQRCPYGQGRRERRPCKRGDCGTATRCSVRQIRSANRPTELCESPADLNLLPLVLREPSLDVAFVILRCVSFGSFHLFR